MGPQLRSGRASLTVTGNHYEGGNSVGIFSYCIGSFFRVDGEGPDEPDASWISTYRECTWVDHAAFWMAATLWQGVYPIPTDTDLQIDLIQEDNSVTDSVVMATGPLQDSMYVLLMLAKGTARIDRCRFERSGNFDPSARGQGFTASAPPAGSLMTSWELRNSEWVRNAAGAGAAIYMGCCNFDLRVRHSVFRCGLNDVVVPLCLI